VNCAKNAKEAAYAHFAAVRAKPQALTSALAEMANAMLATAWEK
jgi:hypothetical protein